MKKPQLEHRHSPAPYFSYIVGFVFSIMATLAAYLFVVADVFSKNILVFVVVGLALVQLVVQVVFFLHVGRGSRWKLVTFIFTALFTLILVVGTMWVMYHLNYNMMDMTPDEMTEHMQHNQGI